MINACFEVEGAANVQLEAATTEDLINEEWVTAFEQTVQAEMDKINNKIEIEFVAA